MKCSISIAISVLVLSGNAIAFAEPFKNNTVRSLLISQDANSTQNE